jgi:hypothetical protein
MFPRIDQPETKRELRWWALTWLPFALLTVLLTPLWDGFRFIGIIGMFAGALIVLPRWARRGWK